MKNCPNCSAPNLDNAAFCESCGAPLEQARENLFAQEQAVTEAFDLEQPSAPKKKKTGLIVGICAGAVCLVAAGAVAAVMLLGGGPEKKLEKAMDKTFAALPAASAETPNLEKAMEGLTALMETQKYGMKMDMNVDIMQDYGDGEPFHNNVKYHANGGQDRENKIASASVDFEVSGEKFAVQFSADDEKMMLAVPDILDTAVSIRTRELGQDLKHLSDIGLFRFDESMMDMSLDLFPEEDGTSAWDAEAFLLRMQTECAEEVKAVKESYTVGKGSASTVSYEGVARDCTAYPVRIDLSACVSLLEKGMDVCVDEYLSILETSMDAADTMNGAADLDILAEFREELETEMDEMFEKLHEIGNMDVQTTCYISKSGYLMGLSVKAEDSEATFLLLGEENPWNDFAFYVTEADGTEETALRGGLTNENGANKFSLEVADAGKLELTYTDSTGAYSVAVYEEEAELFKLTGEVKPVGAGMNVTAAIAGIETEGNLGSFSYTTTIDLHLDLTIDTLTETPKHISENALALGEATEEELYALLMQIMYQ